MYGLHTDSSEFMEIANQITAALNFYRAEQGVIEIAGTYEGG